MNKEHLHDEMYEMQRCLNAMCDNNIKCAEVYLRSIMVACISSNQAELESEMMMLFYYLHQQ